jgi:hypothetical protein
MVSFELCSEEWRWSSRRRHLWWGNGEVIKIFKKIHGTFELFMNYIYSNGTAGGDDAQTRSGP